MTSTRISLLALLLPAIFVGCNCFDQGGLQDALPGAVITTGGETGVEEIERGSRYSIDFGAVEIGRQEVRYFELQNAGQASLSVTGISITGPDRSSFVARPAELEIAPNSASRIEISFGPLVEGEAHATLSFDTNDEQASSVEVMLTGTGYIPAVEVSPRSLDFGPVVVGSTKALSIELSNSSPDALAMVVRPVQPSSMASVYSVDWAGRGTDGRALLEIEESMEIEVTYNPSVTGQHHAGFIIEPCPSCQAVSVSLSGRAVDSALLVEPSSVDFGKINPGHSVTKSVSFRNIGNISVTVDTASLVSLVSGPPDPAFALVDLDLPIVIDAQGTREIEISFSPPDLDLRTAALDWTSNDPRNPSGQVPLNGSGGGPGIELLPRDIYFGQVAVGTTRVRRLVVTNPGEDETTISGISIVSGSAFTVDGSPSFPFALAPGDALLIDVHFSPSAEEESQGILTVSSDVRHEPEATAALHGVGLELGPCEYRLSPEMLHFGNVARNGSITLPLVIENDGGERCLIRDLEISPDSSPAFSMTSGAVESLMLEPGESHEARIRFQPPQHGTFTGSVVFYVSSQESSQGSVSLLGRSYQPDLVLDPSVLDFGLLGSACPIRSRRFCVLNEGSVPATITGVEIIDSGGETVYRLFDLPEELDQGIVVEPGRRSCFFVRFEPTESREYLGVVHVHIAEKDHPLVLPLTGSVSDEGGGGLEGYGCLHGRICGPSGDRWLPDADVLIPIYDEHGSFVDVLFTSTDADGFFTLDEIPAGTRQVVIEKGSFSTDFMVDILDGQVTALEEPECVRADSAKIAIITGSYDSIEEVVARVGATDVTMYGSPMPLVGDLQALLAYNILFINCGADVSPASDPNVQANLRTFVQNGGSLYTSDYAYDYVNNIWPDKVSFVGKQGSAGHVSSSVLDTILASYLGKWVVNINFNMGAWVVADSAAPSVEQVVIADIPSPPLEDAPLMIYFEDGYGRVVFTSFHNDSQTTEDMDTILEYLVFRL